VAIQIVHTSYKMHEGGRRYAKKVTAIVCTTVSVTFRFLR